LDDDTRELNEIYSSVVINAYIIIIMIMIRIIIKREYESSPVLDVIYN